MTTYLSSFIAFGDVVWFRCGVGTHCCRSVAPCGFGTIFLHLAQHVLILLDEFAVGSTARTFTGRTLGTLLPFASELFVVRFGEIGRLAGVAALLLTFVFVKTAIALHWKRKIKIIDFLVIISGAGILGNSSHQG